MDEIDFDAGQLLLIDKPLRWTSFDVVKKLKYALRVKKIGHAGTLDPLATGLLLIGTGKFTKKLHDLQGLDKSYEGIISLGKTTPSYDLETEFDSETDCNHLTEQQILELAVEMTGWQDQIPPAHSAVKIGGERAYKKARRNENVVIEPRHIQLIKFEITKIALPDVHFDIRCSKGTYIRSVARDFGSRLGVGGHLKALRRTAVGDYDIQQAEALDAFIAKFQSDGIS